MPQETSDPFVDAALAKLDQEKRKVAETFVQLPGERPAGKAYDKLVAKMSSEGELLDILARTKLRVWFAERGLAEKRTLRNEQKSVVGHLAKIREFAEKRRGRAAEKAVFFGFFVFGPSPKYERLLAELEACFEEETLVSERDMLGIGPKSGGGVADRSKVTIRRTAVVWLSDQARIITGAEQDDLIAPIANHLFEKLGATPASLKRWRAEHGLGESETVAEAEARLERGETLYENGEWRRPDEGDGS